MTKKHAKFGSPSSLYRLEKCPGSVAFGRDIPEPPPSKYAEEGTLFHKFMEELLPHVLDNKLVGMNPIDAYPDMDSYIEKTMIDVRTIWRVFSATHESPKFEVEVPVTVTDDIYGTADVIFFGRNRDTLRFDITVIDYKYGKGVKVDATESLQGIAYLIGAKNLYHPGMEKIGTYNLEIAQVRLKDGWTSFYINDVRVFNRWERRIKNIVEEVKAIYEDREPLELHAGQHCFFCKCRSVCPEYNKGRIQEIQNSAEDLI